MNELLDSEEELNEADVEEVKDVLGYFAESDDEGSSGSDADDSFGDSEDEEERKRWIKENTAKVNNSFTGPYPLDPIDFDHTDKGPNTQFLHLDVC